MGDFDACRFDFRFDAKNGLTPSKRKRTERVPQVSYGTLFKCKICSSLFPSRQLLLEHKLFHVEYSCCVCNERFAKRSHLREHTVVVHRELSSFGMPPDTADASQANPGSMLSGMATHGETGMPLGFIKVEPHLAESEELNTYLDGVVNVPASRYNSASSLVLPELSNSTKCENLIDAAYGELHGSANNKAVEDYRRSDLSQEIATGGASEFLIELQRQQFSQTTNSSELVSGTFEQPDSSRLSLLTDSYPRASQCVNIGLPESISTSVIATYLAQLQRLQRELLQQNVASYCTIETPLKQRPAENISLFDHNLMISSSIPNEAAFSHPRSPESDCVWDYSTKFNSSSAVSLHRSCSETKFTLDTNDAVDLSFRGVALTDTSNNDSTISVPLEHFDITPSSGNYVERERTLRDKQISALKFNQGVKLSAAKTTAMNRQVTKEKRGLSSMVEKLWKSKMNTVQPMSEMVCFEQLQDDDDLKLKDAVIKYENNRKISSSVIYPPIDEQGGIDVPKESVPSSNMPKNGFCTIKFRACPVCRQLFDTSKAMWDHVMTHKDYRKTRIWKQKRKFEYSNAIATETLDDAQNHLNYSKQLKTSDIDLIAIGIDNSDIAVMKSHLCEGEFRCQFPQCFKSFREKHRLKLHEAIHARMVSPSVCKLCECVTCVCASSSSALNNISKNVAVEQKTDFMIVACDNFVNNTGVSINAEMHSKSTLRGNSELSREFCTGTEKEILTDPRGSDSQASQSLLEADQRETVNSKGCASALTTAALKINMDECELSPIMLHSQQNGNPFLHTMRNQACDRSKSVHQLLQSKLLLKKITPAAGKDPSFYTSLMRITCVNPSQTLESKQIANHPDHHPTLFSSLEDIDSFHNKNTTHGSENTDNKSLSTLSNADFIQFNRNSSQNDESPKFNFDACGHEAFTNADLHAHVISSLNTTPHELRVSCLVCDQSFSTKAELSHHLQQHSEEASAPPQQLVCPCGDCASRHHGRGSLRSHLRRVHLAGWVAARGDAGESCAAVAESSGGGVGWGGSGAGSNGIAGGCSGGAGGCGGSGAGNNGTAGGCSGGAGGCGGSGTGSNGTVSGCGDGVTGCHDSGARNDSTSIEKSATEYSDSDSESNHTATGFSGCADGYTGASCGTESNATGRSDGVGDSSTTAADGSIDAGMASSSDLECLRNGCTKRFDSESALLNHLVAHAEERPLVCNHIGCDRAFRELKHLKVHQMQHTDARPLRCACCAYSCRQRNSLNWHMKSRHGLDKRVTPDGRTFYAYNGEPR